MLTALLWLALASNPQAVSFSGLPDVRAGQTVTVNLAPVAPVVNGRGQPGELYPEPCDAHDPTLGTDGRSRVALIIVGVPAAEARALNAKANAETRAGKRWTCFDVELTVERVTRLGERVRVDARFGSARPHGSRQVDRRLLGGD